MGKSAAKLPSVEKTHNTPVIRKPLCMVEFGGKVWHAVQTTREGHDRFVVGRQGTSEDRLKTVVGKLFRLYHVFS